MQKKTKITGEITHKELGKKIKEASKAVELFRAIIIEKNLEPDTKEFRVSEPACNLIGYIYSHAKAFTVKELIKFLNKTKAEHTEPVRRRQIDLYLHTYVDYGLLMELALNDGTGTIIYVPTPIDEDVVIRVCREHRVAIAYKDPETLKYLYRNVEASKKVKIEGHAVCVFIECDGNCGK